jgi:hypothetical protein
LVADAYGVWQFNADEQCNAPEPRNRACFKWAITRRGPVIANVIRLTSHEDTMPLNDILNCAEAELWNILDSDDAYQHDGWFMCKGIGMIELCKLGEMLSVASYDDLMADFNLIGEPRDDGPWPQTIPALLMAKLAKVTDEEIAAVVPQWAAIDEFFGTATNESLSDYLKRLREYLDGRSGEFFMVNAL